MKAKQREARNEEIKAALRAKGYTEDKYGNLVKEIEPGRQHRYKFQPTSLRKECRFKRTQEQIAALPEYARKEWTDWTGIWTAYTRHVEVKDGVIVVRKKI